MNRNPTYEALDRIHDGQRSTVYRARRREDGLPVVLKSLSLDRPSADDAARFRREHEILKSLEGSGAVTALGLEIVDDHPTIVMTDGGPSLRARLAAGPIPLVEALEIAVRIADAVGAIHRRGVVHKDVKPQNIVLDPADGTVRLVDFGIATRLTRERPSVLRPSVLEGTLIYMSPEQTGRTNRDLDARSDLYSLGVVLYELFTGAVPFRSADPAELVHHHLARAPVPPNERAPGIPAPLSAVILKLLAKAAEDRYQSAAGLRADLEDILHAVRTGAGVPWTAPGSRDAFDRFQLPQKLYGREAPAAALQAAYERAAQGRAELLLVSGYSGIGKSSLVNELHRLVAMGGGPPNPPARPVLARRGYFVSGKFEELRREVPYGSIVQAFTALVRQLLTESEARLAAVRAGLAEALGHNGKVLTDLIPDLAVLLGPQPDVPDLPPAEARNRFNFTVLRFVKALAADHPLALFLDDLQWADHASLKLLEVLLGDPSVSHLLLIGAYRDNEVGPAHALRLTQEALEKGGALVSEIRLRPLDAGDVAAFVADMLHCDPARSEPLARLAFERTLGNPFFLGQFLRALHEDGLIVFDTRASAWSFDLDRIAARGGTENVVALTAAALEKLDPAARSALTLGAAVGSRFDLATIAAASGRTPEDLLHDFEAPLAEGLVLPIDDGLLGSAAHLSLRFVHDRVQQAAYARLAPDERRAVHRRLGRILLDCGSAAERESRLFEIVNHHNLGMDETSSPEDRIEAARWNLLAAEKAWASSAAAPALHYARTGIGLLAVTMGGDPPARPADAFASHYELARDLHFIALVAEFAGAAFDALATRADLLLSVLRTPLEKSRVYETLIYANTARSELTQAIENGARALGLLGIELPGNVDFPRFLQDLAVTQGLLAGRSAADLDALPESTSAEAAAAMRIFVAIASTAYLLNPLLSLHIYLQMFNLCLKHGLSEMAPFAFAVYGLINSAVLGDLDTGYTYGKAALDLAVRYPSPRVRCRAGTQVGLFIQHWKDHIRTSIALMFEAVGAGLEGGDLEYVGYASIGIAMYAFFAGEPLDEVAREDARLVELLRQNGLLYAEECLRACRQAIHDLSAGARPEAFLEGEEFRASTAVPAMIAVGNNSTLSLVHVLTLILQYVFDDYAGAVATAEKGEAYISAQLGQVAGVELNLYQSLSLLALAGSAEGEARAAMLAKVEKNQEALARWAASAPMNYRHAHLLVEAERARVRGDHREAVTLLDEAVGLAAKEGYLREVAIAHELTADVYFAMGRERAARAALAEAGYAYAHWGASAKVDDLARRHSFLAPKRAVGPDDTTSTTSTKMSGGAVLDTRALMKAAAVISGEIVLDKLLAKVMEIAIENAGAERGLLILAHDDGLVIAAQRSVGGSAESANLLRAPVTMGPRAAPNPARWRAPVEGSDLLSAAIVNLVARTREGVVLADAAAEGLFTADPYVARNRPRSVLCAPLVNQGRLVALLYLENNLTAGAFTEERLSLLRMLSVQAALSIQNAELFASVAEHSRTLEQRVEARTRELSQKNDELASTVTQLRDAQRRLATQEKLASLGALTAGIAHELKNPLNFVNNFADLSAGMVTELTEIVSAQRSRLDEDAAADASETLEMLESNLAKIHQHGRRADEILNAMLQHTRSKGAREREAADLNKLVRDSVDLAHHAARGKDPTLEIRVEASYEEGLGPVEVSTQEMGRVILNLVDNACYAMAQRRRIAKGYTPVLAVRTRSRGDRVEIRIRDNGSGIPAAVLGQVFNPFFTTKPAGEGAGLGLSLSHDIVVGHGGEIEASSVEGDHTEVVITLPRRQADPASRRVD